MKFIEETLLKNTMENINTFIQSHKTINDYYEDVNKLDIESLQSFSFKKDNEFFDEVSFVLSVINSIISHPHILSKREEIILRSELAGSISNDSLQQTYKDTSLWKEKDIDI